ncbi:MAG TPA: hypothetical protein VMU81_31170 [Acetobacteraceae bacterium]|jgi:hypothetical protein|nr:hypothetical protein [Acetobacteraceae bacterium]
MLTPEEHDEIVAAMVENPVGFLETTIIRIGGEPNEKWNNKTPAAPRRFSLQKSRKYSSGKTCALTEAIGVDASIVNGRLEAFYLPWASGRKLSLLLPSNSTAKLFFTAALTGCAVGFWRAPDSGAKVYHVNETGDGAAQKMQATLEKAINKKVGKDGAPKAITRTPGGIFNMANYGWDDSSKLQRGEQRLGGGVYGVRREEAWRFYGQRLVIDWRGSWEVKEVIAIG